MVYHFIIKANKKRGQNKDKDFWLSADSEKELYRRASQQYIVDVKEIEIIESKTDKEVGF